MLPIVRHGGMRKTGTVPFGCASVAWSGSTAFSGLLKIPFLLGFGSSLSQGSRDRNNGLVARVLQRRRGAEAPLLYCND